MTVQTQDLAARVRPKSLSEVVGQAQAVRQLADKVRRGLPPATIIHGPTGTGKTTLARIVATGGTIREINCAEVRGIDSVREIQDDLRYRPLAGGRLFYVLDEVVQLPKATQQAFLKVLEEPPTWAHFLLCTTALEGLLPTFLDRCFRVELKALTVDDLRLICDNALRTATGKADHDPAWDPLIDKVALHAGGSGRRAVRILEQVLPLEPKDRLAAVAGVQDEEKAEFLARLLAFRRPWAEVRRALEGLSEQDVEGVRRQCLAYLGKAVLGGWRAHEPNLCCEVIRELEYSFRDGGHAALIRACYRLCHKSPAPGRQ